MWQRVGVSYKGAAWLLGCGLAIRVRRGNKGAAWLLVCGMANLGCGVAIRGQCAWLL
jgi:hypothetical protein